MTRDVVVAGVGQTAFGDTDQDLRELGAEAARNALDDATGLSKDQITAGFVGNVGTPASPQHSLVGQVCLREVGITGIPIVNIENACSSSSSAFHQAYRTVAGGFEDVAIVLGVEKMTGISTEEATKGVGNASDVRLESDRGLTFPALYSMRAKSYAEKYDIGNLREALTAVSVKNHHNGTDNPNAHFTHEIEPADVDTSSLVADPLRVYDFCPNSDGAAAIIIASRDSLPTCPEPEISVEASVHVTGMYDDESHDLADAGKATKAADKAYEQAGLGSDDIDVFEVHDAATIGELQKYEALGITDSGEATTAVLDETTSRDGEYPVNPSGGLKARGHPLGATGIAQLNELVWQLRGDLSDRQIEGASTGLAENAGGALNGVGANSTIHILCRSE